MTEAEDEALDEIVETLKDQIRNIYIRAKNSIGAQTEARYRNRNERKQKALDKAAKDLKAVRTAAQELREDLKTKTAALAKEEAKTKELRRRVAALNEMVGTAKT